MSKDVSIVFKASDNLTKAVCDMQGKVNSLTKDVLGYRKIQDQAFGERVEVKYNIEQAKGELRELTKEVRNNVGYAEQAFKEKQLSLERLNEEYRRLGQVAKEASNAERQLQDDISKTSNANASRGSLLDDVNQSGGIIGALGAAGMGNMMLSSIQDYSNTMLSSMFGSNIGGAAGGIVGNIASGAAMGSIIPGIGTAVGAAVGGLTGAIEALGAKQERADDFFREETKNLFTDVTTRMDDTLSSSSGIAAERELTLEKFKAMMGGTEGSLLFEELKQYGVDTPYSTDNMMKSGTLLRRYNSDWGREDIMNNVSMIGDLAMGDQNAFDAISYAYAQIQSEGKLNGQDWRQLTQAGFNPLDVLGEEWGKTAAQMREMMSDGVISAEDVTHAFEAATSEGGEYFQSATKLMDSYSGVLAQLEDTQLDIDLAMGEGFNKARKEGMEKELEAYSGETGDIMRDAYEMIGAYEAELENQHRQSIIDAINGVYELPEYKEAIEKGNGLEAEKLMWKAKMKAETDYKNSDEVMLKKQAEQDLVGDIQDALIEDGTYVHFGEEMANQFSQGWNKNLGSQIYEALRGITKRNLDQTGVAGSALGYKPHATGLSRVPYDGYKAELHEGERVLTRVEADQASSGSIHIAKLADSIIVREEADIDKLTQALVAKLKAASTVYGGYE